MGGRDTSERPNQPDIETLHASCVALDGRAVLIRGASSSGKSGLALNLMAMGAELVADDRTQVWRDGNTLMADAPDRLRGLIEARDVGILRVPSAGPKPIAFVINMDEVETDRLPEHRQTQLLGHPITVLRKSTLPHFPATIIAYLRGQRETPDFKP
ncbi:MAG: HPr kinase/phosphatase C-terminal domain-containing protein [Pseudomonadota bacterium]